MKTKIIKSENIPTGRTIPITEPVARIDMKTIPYQVYTEFVIECNERGISFKQLFVEMWENHKK